VTLVERLEVHNFHPNPFENLQIRTSTCPHFTNGPGKAMENHSGKYVIRQTEYAAVPFCSVDVSSPGVSAPVVKAQIWGARNCEKIWGPTIS